MPSFEPNLYEDVQALKREVAELHRKRDRNLPRLGDLRDVNGWGAQTGYVLAYDQTIGRFKPMLAPPFLKFSTVGDDVPVVESGHDPVAAPGRLTLVKARLATAGSSTTTALLKHNGSTVVTVTFTSGNVTPSLSPTTVDYAFDADDYWSLDITAAGTAASGLVVAGWGTGGAAP